MRGEHSFAVPTKFFALLCAMLGIFLVKNILFTTVLVIFCFVYVGFQRNYRLMTSCGAFYLLLSLLLYAIRFWGYHTVIISEFLVLFFWSSMVMLMLFWDLFMTPPGELSSFLSSIHMPTGVILGLMVIFRFFPTMKAELKAVGLSMKNRGLTSVRQFAVHPLASVEYVLVPLLLRILQIADQLAVSAVARGAECPGVRKSYYETTMHTYITNLIHSSVDPKTVQYLAGHESSKITMDIYAKVKYNRPDELVKSMGGAFAQWDGV